MLTFVVRRLLLAVPVLVLLALLLSVLLFEGLRGWRFHRAMVFLPYVLPIPVVAVIFGLLGIGMLVGMTGMGGGSLMTPMLILLFGIKPSSAISSEIVASG